MVDAIRAEDPFLTVWARFLGAFQSQTILARVSKPDV